MPSLSKECGIIVLDLLLKAALVVKGGRGQWILADDYESHRIYLVNDAKTAKIIVKFVRDMQDRRTTYHHASIQAEIFLSDLGVVMALPGDWDTGLNMVQSIFNFCFSVFG